MIEQEYKKTLVWLEGIPAMDFDEFGRWLKALGVDPQSFEFFSTSEVMMAARLRFENERDATEALKKLAGAEIRGQRLALVQQLAMNEE